MSGSPLTPPMPTVQLPAAPKENWSSTWTTVTGAKLLTGQRVRTLQGVRVYESYTKDLPPLLTLNPFGRALTAFERAGRD
jgi:hypothetical protein